MARLEDIELPSGDTGPTVHLNPVAAFHPIVLLPGDPARAMAIATAELENPRMFNHRRGLWGYSGTTPSGVGITIQSSGMGGPSAAIVAEELCDLGAELIVRVGTCGALSPSVTLGDLIVVTEALSNDGTSKILADGNALPGDAQLTGALAANRPGSERKLLSGKVASVDLFYDPAAEQRHQALIERGAIAIEMEAATVFAVAARRGVRAACLLGVSDELHPGTPRKRLGQEEIEQLGVDLGALAISAVEAADDTRVAKS